MAQRQEPFLSDGLAVNDLLGDDRPAPGRSRLLLPTVVSVLVHAVALVWMIHTDVRLPEITAPPAPTSIRISFVPDITPPSPESPLEPESPLDIAQDVQVPAVPPEVMEALPTQETAELSLPPAQPDTSTPDQLQEEPDRPRLHVPTTAELRTAVNGAAAQQRERALLMDCDTLQQRHPLFDCATRDNVDFSVLEASIVADYYARGTAEVPVDTGEGYTNARQTAQALRMIDTANRTFITRDRVMGGTP